MLTDNVNVSICDHSRRTYVLKGPEGCDQTLWLRLVTEALKSLMDKSQDISRMEPLSKSESQSFKVSSFYKTVLANEFDLCFIVWFCRS